MDRPTVISGQIPLETDILRSGQFAMVGNAKTNEAILGTTTCVSGFTLVPTGPATLSAILGPGVVFQQQNLEATTWSSLPADTHTIVKQGIALDAQNLTFTPPTTVGQSQAFLIEVAYQDVDTGAVVRPYYNAANPTVQFNGPGGAGTADNTIRKGAVQVQIKAGVAATSGTQVTPSPDAGFVGLFVVTLAQGATTVTSGNITAYSPSSFIPTLLTRVPSDIQAGQWVYGAASGTNTYTATLFSTAAYPFALTAGMEILVFFNNANTTTSPTLNCNGLGAKPILKQGAGAPSAGDIQVGFVSLIYDGANWRINGFVTSDIVAIIAANVRVRLQNNLTVYVRTDGNDANDGSANTAAKAFATIQAAYNAMTQKYDTAGYSITIQLGNAGTYVGATFQGFSGSILLVGDQAAPGSYLIRGQASTDTPIVAYTNSLSIRGVTLATALTLGGPSNGVFARSGSVVNLRNVIFSPGFYSANHQHIAIEAGASLYTFGTLTFQTAGGDAAISVSEGGAYQGGFSGDPTTITVTGALGWNTAFCRVVDGTAKFGATTVTPGGTSTGPRYNISLNGVINTYGGGASFLPGNAAGVIATGGQYA